MNIYFTSTFFYSRFLGTSLSKQLFSLVLYTNHHQTSFKPSFKLQVTANLSKLSFHFQTLHFMSQLSEPFPNYSIFFSPNHVFSLQRGWSQHTATHKANFFFFFLYNFLSLLYPGNGHCLPLWAQRIMAVAVLCRWHNPQVCCGVILLLETVSWLWMRHNAHCAKHQVIQIHWDIIGCFTVAPACFDIGGFYLVFSFFLFFFFPPFFPFQKLFIYLGS